MAPLARAEQYRAHRLELIPIAPIMRLASKLNSLLPTALQPVPWAAARYVRQSGYVIQGGPFRGLRYVRRAHCSALPPKIAGTYEQELHAYLPRLFAGRPDVFVDVGAAEGYYAVGVAVAGWSDRVIAFEAEPDALAACRELMAANHVDAARLDLRGACTPEALQSVLAAARPALMIDVEGFEAFLLDPLRVPDLARCPILLEYHDFVLPGLSDEIRRRFAPTHDITPIGQAPRRADDLVTADPLLRALPADIRRRVLSEQRPFSRHGWFWMQPRTA